MRPFSASPSSRGATIADAVRPKRKLRAAFAQAPATLRALVRADEIWLVALAAAVGGVAGVIVVGMSAIAQEMHRLLFTLAPGEFLSSQYQVDVLRALLVPTLGGLVLGGAGILAVRWGSRRTVDPIEANALYGGTMSLKDSLIVVLQTIWSNGVGASVGLEAGYAQIGSALASRLGRAFRLRRSDMRLLVGCGAAGAIAAAFNAPLTGAFYAFELVIGTYSLVTLAPVVVAAISAVTAMRILLGGGENLDIRVPTAIEAIDYVPILALGMICALGGIADHARGHARRGAVPAQQLAGLVAPGGGRRRDRRPGSGLAGGAVIGALGDAGGAGCAVFADPCGAADRVEGAGVGRQHRVGVPRRPVLRLAVPGRVAGQAVCRAARVGHGGAGAAGGGVCASSG